MAKLPPYVETRKTFEPYLNSFVWRAYWVGTNNQVSYKSGGKAANIKRSDLVFMLNNNPIF